MSTDDAAPTPFDDLDAYIALPRLAGLWLSPDGTRLITSAATLDPKRTKYVSALWEVDPAGDRPARRLTRSAAGESAAAPLPDGSLLFCSARPDPAATDGDDKAERTHLWLLPAGGGEAAVVASRPGGITGPVVARESGTVVVSSATLPASADLDGEEELRKRRKEHKVAAILHERAPVRHWDHDIGPGLPRLFVGDLDVSAGDDPTTDPALELRDLAPDAGMALRDADYDISADGTLVVTTWRVTDNGAEERSTLVAIDVATGERRVLADDHDFNFFTPRISPDGSAVAAGRGDLGSPTEAPDEGIVVVSTDGGEQRAVAADWDRWPSDLAWTPDGTTLIVAADEDGRGPLFRVDVATGTVTRLTGDDFTYSSLAVAPDGATVYALRTSYLEPQVPVALDADGAGPASRPLVTPTPPPSLPGRLDEIETTASDGARVRAWLALPHSASGGNPAPLLLWVHGGPLSSWNAWSWRWNPWLMVARGYAVLLPDPALSTGYGRDFVARGWAQWGGAPYTDLMTITDAAVARDDIDEQRTAAMGGSFGGYMANWIAGHTDRFDAIVTHASLWALDQFGPTTDHPWYWRRQMSPEVMEQNSPHRHVGSITTPLLVIHGDRDYRVPIGEALRLWADLTANHDASADTTGELPHKFLYFPDENHWILTPQHAKVWYETVFAFLAHHVLGEAWAPPELLGAGSGA